MPIISKEIKIALLGISAIALFVFGYNYLKGTGMFSSAKTILAEYENVQGLTPASYVQMQGFNIGTVKKIELSKAHPGKVLVTMMVDKTLQIPSNSKASIVSSDLLGTKAVDLVIGNASTMVKENELLQGSITLGAIDNLSASAGPAIDNAKIALASLDETIHSINNVLDINTQNNLKHSIVDMRNSMNNFSQFTSELNAQRTKISSLIANLNAFSATLEKNGASITRVLNNTEAATDKLNKIDFEGTITELKKTIEGLQATLDKVNNGKGSMAMMMNDDKLYRNLKNTLATANNLLADINAHPSRYINVAIFGKKHKVDCPPQPAPNANE